MMRMIAGFVVISFIVRSGMSEDGGKLSREMFPFPNIYIKSGILSFLWLKLMFLVL